jgi:peptidoglycan hydrolase-like protein with peptidoglycan-binding domain
MTNLKKSFITFACFVAMASPGLVAHAATASIQSLTPGTTVTAKNKFTFKIVTSGFTNPTYKLSDSFGNSTLTVSNIDPVGTLNWVPAASDAGVHVLTVTVTDSDANYATASQTITVLPPPSISILSVSPSASIMPGTKLTFKVVPSGFTNPKYIVSDMYGNGTTINETHLDVAGNFAWTPDQSQNGDHVLTVYATDSTGSSATVKLPLRVGNGPTLVVQPITPGTTVKLGEGVFFSVAALNFSPTGYSAWDKFTGTTISNSNINTSGNFAWNPQPSDVGVHTILITGQVGAFGESASTTVTLTVLGPGGALPAAPSASAATTSSGSALDVLQAQLAQLQLKLASQSSSGGTAVPATSGYVFTTYLKPGSTGEAVTQLQTILTKQGFFSGPISGSYGPMTVDAVVKFQAAQGLTQLGVVGPATRAALNALAGTSATPAATTVVPASTSGFVFNHFMGVGDDDEPDVLELQKKLMQLGYLSAAPTGYYGGATETAVKKFQRANGLPETGYVNRATRTVLNQK